MRTRGGDSERNVIGWRFRLLRAAVVARGDVRVFGVPCGSGDAGCCGVRLPGRPAGKARSGVGRVEQPGGRRRFGCRRPPHRRSRGRRRGACRASQAVRSGSDRCRRRGTRPGSGSGNRPQWWPSRPRWLFRFRRTFFLLCRWSGGERSRGRGRMFAGRRHRRARVEVYAGGRDATCHAAQSTRGTARTPVRRTGVAGGGFWSGVQGRTRPQRNSVQDYGRGATGIGRSRPAGWSSARGRRRESALGRRSG